MHLSCPIPQPPLICYHSLEVAISSGILKTDHCDAARFSAQSIACSSVSKEIIFFPCFTFSIAFSSRSRLAGELQRYSVSSCSLTVISMFWSGYASLKEVIKLASSSLVLSLNTASIPVIITETANYYKRLRNSQLPPLFIAN